MTQMKEKAVEMIEQISDENMIESKLQTIIEDIVIGLQKIVKSDLEAVILYGSYARGDYDLESDIDIAVLLSCDRFEMKKYTDTLADLMVDLNLEHDILVNFCCIPYTDFAEKKNILPYYMNIEREGINLIA